MPNKIKKLAMKSMVLPITLSLMGGVSILSAETSLKQVELNISGMTCQGRALGAQFTLERLEGDKVRKRLLIAKIESFRLCGVMS